MDGAGEVGAVTGPDTRLEAEAVEWSPFRTDALALARVVLSTEALRLAVVHASAGEEMATTARLVNDRGLWERDRRHFEKLTLGAIEYVGRTARAMLDGKALERVLKEVAQAFRGLARLAEDVARAALAGFDDGAVDGGADGAGASEADDAGHVGRGGTWVHWHSVRRVGPGQRAVAVAERRRVAAGDGDDGCGLRSACVRGGRRRPGGGSAGAVALRRARVGPGGGVGLGASGESWWTRRGDHRADGGREDDGVGVGHRGCGRIRREGREGLLGAGQAERCVGAHGGVGAHSAPEAAVHPERGEGCGRKLVQGPDGRDAPLPSGAGRSRCCEVAGDGNDVHGVQRRRGAAGVGGGERPDPASADGVLHSGGGGEGIGWSGWTRWFGRTRRRWRRCCRTW